ncbi:hypothetical protein [Halalkalicoccus subterraneus]|uniref:hypothetical protein n=1 Tax=Halalkalicoccus subterraneus TaxID=2675002 RepID=UPI0013CF23D3|nr:hypothetical protein [Halalkalicoccus subterraneus]
MPSKKTIGIAPLVTGIFLASQSFGQILDTGLSLWAGISFTGGFSAILVGAGILLQWGGFDTESEETSGRLTTMLLGIALVSFVVGAAVAII